METKSADINWTKRLESLGLARRIESIVGSRFELPRKEIGRAWSTSLLCCCSGTSIAVLLICLPLRRLTENPSLFLDEVVAGLILANLAFVGIWLVGFFKFQGSDRVYRIQSEVADECAAESITVCAQLLAEADSELAKYRESVAKSAGDRAGDAVRGALAVASIAEVEQHLLSKFVGATFVETQDQDLVIYFTEACARCGSKSRKGHIHRFAIPALRAQVAGLTRSNVVAACGQLLRFNGPKDAYERFLGRELTELESLRFTHDTRQFYCESCGNEGISTGQLRPVVSPVVVR